MQIEALLDDNLHKKYLIQYTPVDIEECVYKEAEEMQPEVAANGFRKGKVPLSQIVRIYGQKLQVEVLNKKITEDIRTVVEQNKYQLAVNPVYAFRDRTQTGDENYLIEVDFYLFPEVPDTDFSTLELPEYKMDPADVEATVENNLLLFQIITAEFKQKSEEPIVENDRVLLDVAIEIDGEPADGLGGEIRALIGHNQLPDEVEEKIVGAKNGDRIAFTHSYAPDAKNLFYKGVLGKTVGFEVEIKDVQSPILTEMNDEKVKKLGFADAEDLLKTLETNTKNTLNNLSEKALRARLFDYIADNHKFDIAEFVIDQEAHIIAYTEEERLRATDMMEKVVAGLGKVDITDTHREKAVRQLTIAFTLSDYGRKNDIKVTNEEVKREMEEHLEELSRMNRIKPDKKEQNFKEFTQRVQTLVFENKMTAHILSKVKRKETFLPKDEFFDTVKEEV